MSKKKWDFRDISVGLKMLRQFLLGRKHDLENLHGRFAPRLAPRSLPPPDIPRGPIYKYSDQYYCERNAIDSVKMPIVAPYAEGAPKSGSTPSPLTFKAAPTPGCTWWWDGHCYYNFVPPPPKVAKPLPPCPPPVPPPKPPPCKPEPKTQCQKVCEGAK